MDLPNPDAKKRKLEENGGHPPHPSSFAIPSPDISPPPSTTIPASGLPSYLTPQVARLMVDTLSKDELAHIVVDASLRHRDVLQEVRSLADRDPSRRKIFVRGLGWDTNSLSLRNAFSEFGELEEAIAIMDKATGRSRGYGFVTFRHMDGAINALREPSKRIDGRISVCQLASLGSAAAQPPQDLPARKIYVGNVPLAWPVDRLVSIFSEYGDIEEGPLGLEKQAGKERGFALFIYKTVEGAKRALEEPVKNIGGHQLFCKLAVEGGKQKMSMHGQTEMPGLSITQPGGPVAASSNMPYGGGQYGAAAQGMMTQPAPYSQNIISAMNPSLNQGMKAALHLNVAGGSISSQSAANNPVVASSMNPIQGPSITATGGKVPPAMAVPSYGSHGTVDPYGSQAATYGGQHGGYSGPGNPAYNVSQSSSVQGQYGMASYQNQPSYQGQQQMPLSYPSQQQTTAPHMQSTGVHSASYYGM